MTTPELDPITPAPVAVPAPGSAEDAVTPEVPVHPDASAAVTARWESDGGHLHR